MDIFWAVATASFRRQSAYRAANLAGLFTNSCFGFLRSELLLAVHRDQPRIGGYDAVDAVTFIWVTQALLMVVTMWGWLEIADNIQSGDVAIELGRPMSFLGYWGARFAGRGAYFLVFRCLPVLAVGQVLYGLRWPTEPVVWVALVASVALAIAVSFAWRFLINLVAFWTTEARGIAMFADGVASLLSGLIVPLVYFPDWIRPILLALPFAAVLQVPADIFLGQHSGGNLIAAVALQACWAVVLLGLGQLLVRAGARRVAIQGG